MSGPITVKEFRQILEPRLEQHDAKFEQLDGRFNKVLGLLVKIDQHLEK